MEELIGLRLIGAIAAAFFVASIVRLVVRPEPRLAGRVRPYTAASRSVLGRLPERNVVFSEDEPTNSQNALQRVFRPVLESLTESITRLVGRPFDDQALLLKLRQAGVLADVPEEDRVNEFRIRQVASGLLFGVVLSLSALIVGLTPALSLLFFVAGAVFGSTKRSSSIQSRIERRRERMQIELYTVNQLLAIYLRTGGSPVLAVQRLVKRGRGVVIEELDEAMRLHARGMSAERAFTRIAEQTPETYAARTYKLLASGSERGADLAASLLSLSEDLRDHRRTQIRRSATKKQAAVLLPIIFLLAPVMLLFISAPLPRMLFRTLQ